MGRLQVTAPPSQVWLQVVSLGPLVPGIHEHNTFVARSVGERVFDDGAQPSLVEFRRRPVENVGTLFAPGRVVPAGSRTAEALIGDRRSHRHSFGESTIREDVALPVSP